MVTPKKLCGLVAIGALSVAALACSANDTGSTLDDLGGGNGAADGAGANGSGANGSGANGTGANGSSANGSGGDSLIDDPGTGGPGDACGASLPTVYRDFKAFTEGGHPDFEGFPGRADFGCGIVAPQRGADSKPVFQASNGVQRRLTSNGAVEGCTDWQIDPNTIGLTVTSAETFNQWYNTIEGVNQEIAGSIPLAQDPTTGKFVFDSAAFFPLDGQGFGNYGDTGHNYHFTTEIHVLFEYTPGNFFTFRGDDDLWIFVNGVLAVDLGGLHEPLLSTVSFDNLGLEANKQYQMDIFHAERHTNDSNFRIETNISCFRPVIK